MERIKAKLASKRDAIKNDHNLNAFRRSISEGGSALPVASRGYVVKKVPAIKWLPQYMPRWLVGDVISGVTVGFLLIPQALSYSALAGIPLQQGLLASWLPPLIYAFMGTSKDLSTGPTSIIGLLTGQVVLTFTTPPPALGGAGSLHTGAVISSPAGAAGHPLGPPFAIPSPAVIAAALSICIGILSIIVGSLNLGWLFDLISVPVFLGFFMSACLIIVQGQVPDLLGIVGVSNIFVIQGKEIVKKITTANPFSVAIGVSSILLLAGLQYIGTKWGTRHPIIRILSISRNAIVLVLFTIISFGVNQARAVPLFAITGKVPRGIQTPKIPDVSFGFFTALGFLSVPIFFVASLEHVLIAKSFGHKNKYEVDQSQEMVFLGVANIINGLFGGMPVSGALASTAINRDSGVKSPLGGIFSSVIVLIGIFGLNGVIIWIPKATLAAIIMVAVFNMLPPQSVMLRYWKVSFIDFLASFISMNVTIVGSPQNGIGLGVLFMVAYTLIRIVFAHAKPTSRNDLMSRYGNDSFLGGENNHIPVGTQILSFTQPIVFLNANRIKRDIMDTVMTFYSGVPEDERTKERLWNDLGEKRIVSLRRKANFDTATRDIPRIRVLILDLTGCTMIDTTSIEMLEDTKAALLAYGGEDLELRFVGLNDALKSRLQRAGWQLANPEERMSGLSEGKDGMWELLRPAIEARKPVRESGMSFGLGQPEMVSEGGDIGDEEKGKADVNVTAIQFEKWEGF